MAGWKRWAEAIRSDGAHRPDQLGAFEPVQSRVGPHCGGGLGPFRLFALFARFSKYSNQIKLVTYEKGTSMGSNFSKLCKGVDLNIMNNFAHLPNFIFNKVWYHGYHIFWTWLRVIGRPTKSWPTQPKCTGQEALN
jgi:hypothetical protein